MGLTIADVLSQPPLEGARLLAGFGGLRNEIKTVTFMEHMDVRSWLHGGELLLTTAYAVKEDEARQCRLIADLAEARAAGLVIKLKRFVEQLAPGALALAEELGLPVIEMPVHFSFVDIINPVLTSILNHQAAALNYAQQVNERLTGLATTGGGLQALARVLAELVGNPVFVMDSTGAQTRAVGPAPTQLPGVPGPVPAALRALLSATTPAEPRRIGRGSLRRAPFPYGGQIVEGLVGAVFVGDEVEAFLMVPEVSPLPEMGVVAIEQALTVMALEVAQQRRVAELDRTYRHAFLEDVLAGRLTAAEITGRAGRYSVNLAGVHAIMVVSLAAEASAPEPHRAHAQVFRLLTEMQRREQGVVAILDRGQTLVAFLAVPASLDRGPQSEWLRALGHKVLEGLGRTAGRAGVRVGVGPAVPEAMDLRRSFEGASQVLRIGERLRGNHLAVYFDDLGVYRLLSMVENREALAGFARDHLGSLLEHDRAHPGHELIPTLSAYLKCGSNLKETAAALHVHYGTVRYRIGRIQFILATDLRSFLERTNLLLATAALDYLQTI